MEKDDQLHTEQSQQSEPQGNPALGRSAGPIPLLCSTSGTHFQHSPPIWRQPDALIAANPQIPNPAQIRPGQCLHSAGGLPQGTFAYTVQRGDTMFSIARMFNVTLQALIDANPQISDPANIVPGQTVCVPVTGPPPGQCPPGTFAYTVHACDSMLILPKGLEFPQSDRANPQLPTPNLIFPGQIVCVPTGPSPGPCPPGTFAYTVRPGDSMFSIAQRFGVSLNALIAANPQIPNPNLIFPGQTVCVPNR